MDNDAALKRNGWRGHTRDGVECYYGIRYAELSQAQHARSAPVAASTQISAADVTEVPVFPQLPTRLEKALGQNGRLNPQDDAAFFLNVWAPADSSDLPVLVFIHGGGWITGGGSMRWYRGEQLARDGVVTVTFNYRIGPGGHLAPDDDPDDSAHRPFEDMVMALRWVQAHIAEFGGDPSRVTLAGQSAGAWYSWALASLPEAAGLFRRAGLLSVPEIQPWTAGERRAFTDAVLTSAAENAAGSEQEQLLLAGVQALATRPATTGAIPPMYQPMLPGTRANLLRDAASAAAAMHVDAVYLRITHHEMSVFLPWADLDAAQRDALLNALRDRGQDETLPGYPVPPAWDDDYASAVSLATWLTFGRFTQHIADAVSSRGVPVTLREFAALAGEPTFGAVHCIDLPFQFGNRDDWLDAPMMAGWEQDAFEQLSRATREDLLAFVRGDSDARHKVLG